MENNNFSVEINDFFRENNNFSVKINDFSWKIIIFHGK